MSFLRHFYQFSTMSSLNRPLFTAMTQKFTNAFNPTVLDIVDESTMHAEHAAMRDHGYNETHFKITIVSDAFKGKMPVARHRMVYALLDDEFKNGLHAINIITKTPEEFSKSKGT